MHPLGRLLPAAALCASVLLPVVAPAQPFPSKPVRLVTGSQAGGGTDITARAIQQAVAPLLGVPVVIDNRPGTAGMVANDFVAKQPPDGQTLLIQPGSFVTISPQLNALPRWDTMKHLAAVVQVSTYDLVLVAHPSVPARNVKELIAVARAKPGMISFASSGVGSNFQLAGELLKLEAKVDMLHVAYRGSPPAVLDLVAGRVDTMFVHVPTVKGHIDAGRLRALAMTGTRRSALLPEVPTIAESGLKAYEISGIEGIFAPIGTPREIVARLNSVVGGALSTPEMKASWASKGIEFVPNTPEQFAAKVQFDYDKTAALIKAADIRPER
ncbi:MAG: tripartite tricarboxylate transporter substrate binding protein [Rhodocyclaceae bacterium]|jgi:tripartite-type tricarboxylate transporter receptor subunit TctC|nr:tripartite tricarboxylate transporter substrate binding protein [Rhodocyclaceae bacterium]MCA3097200.1 tripartite tricarboxylate transporter substrate binding protein [Rhodocyclaceae bacterium]MCA3122726.1 tripartite tricarboxylate transporter substrate binding protein [Rhodocyclaceae bacterium]MCA3126154.1 tripartite tricarboxylate transporter substrate binding protein [Rhodocyclaceae bacterium]MCA3138503.1 tripartite tricarboxylate transporter substrate binding protein [Rhodocyclaceae bact